MTEANIVSNVSTTNITNTHGQESEDNKKLIRGAYQSWKNDHNEEGKTSLDTIVDWLAEGENYSKYKGSLKTPGEANKKTAYCKDIAEILVETGHTHRDFKGIMSQITELETKFKLAVKELRKCASANNLTDIDLSGDHNETVIDAKGNRKLLKDVVKKKFKYFYVLRSMFIKWEENLDTESSETAVHEISTSPSSSKRQREHEEQYFDAPDTETRDDAHAHENRVPSSSTVIDLEHSNHVHANHHENTAAMYNHNHNSSNHNTNIISNNQHPPIFPTYRMPFQYPPQHCNLIASNDSEQIRKKQKKLQKRQAEERFSQTLNILLEEQKETVVSKRKTEDKHVLLEEERLLLEKKKLALEERRIALEEKKEERLAFFATLEKLGSADPEYSELMSLFIKKQLSCE